MKQKELLGGKKFSVSWRSHVQREARRGARIEGVVERFTAPDMNGNGMVAGGNGKKDQGHGKGEEVNVIVSLLSRSDGIPDIVRYVLRGI